MTASENQGWRPPRRWPTRLYLFSLVTLTCFLVTMFVYGDRAQLHVAAFTVEAPPADTGQTDGRAAAEAIAADDNLLQVATDLGLHDADDPADDQLVLATLRDGLRLRAANGAPAVTIEYADRERAQATAVARQIADRHAGTQRRQAAAKREQQRQLLHERLQQARDEQQRAELRLQEFLDEALPVADEPVTVFEFGQPGPTAADDSDAESTVAPPSRAEDAIAGPVGIFPTGDDPPLPPTDEAPDSVLPGPPGVVIGPDDLFPQEFPRAESDPAGEMEAQITELVRLRDNMMEEMTTAHPQVQEITKKIAVLREQAAAARAAGSPEAAAEPISREQQLAMLKESDSDQGREYRALLQHIELATTAVAEAEVAEQQAWQQPSEDTPLAKVGPLQQGVAWHRDRWLRLASMAIVLAGAIAMGVVLLAGAGETTYLNVEQAASELPVPVVGVLTTGKPAGLSGPRLAAWLARGIKLTCELGVVALVLWVVLLLARDAELLEQARENPLSVTSVAWERTWQLFGR